MNFILRTINSEEGISTNVVLGKHYIITSKKDSNIFATISSELEEELSLFKDRHYYILNENGKTFEKLNY